MNGIGVNAPGAANTTFGMAAYIQCTAFIGTFAQIRIEASQDDGVGDAYATITGGTFTSVTGAPSYERIETALDQTIEAWTRVTAAGPFTNVTFAVSMCRYLVDRVVGA